MFARFIAVLVPGLVVAGLASADPPARPRNEARPSVEEILSILHHQSISDQNGIVKDTPLFELLQSLSKRYNLSIVVNEEAFKVEGVVDIKERKPTFSATQFRGLNPHQFLGLILGDLNATYLIRNGLVEIVPVAHAARITKSSILTSEDAQTYLAQPLVSIVVKEKPLNEVVAELAELFDLNVVVAPQSGDARTGFVTARLLNVPADRALEHLALQCDLRVAQKGNVFLITSRDQIDALFNEQLEKEKAKIEVEKLRTAKPEPEPKPEPKPKNDK
jgi:hypothetical protein